MRLRIGRRNATRGDMPEHDRARLLTDDRPATAPPIAAGTTPLLKC